MYKFHMNFSLYQTCQWKWKWNFPDLRKHSIGSIHPFSDLRSDLRPDRGLKIRCDTISISIQVKVAIAYCSLLRRQRYYLHDVRHRLDNSLFPKNDQTTETEWLLTPFHKVLKWHIGSSCEWLCFSLCASIAKQVHPYYVHMCSG